jgi:two-component system OmpR family response regulator
VDVQVSRLRRKIEPEEGSPQLIKTVRGAGYVFVADVARA